MKKLILALFLVVGCSLCFAGTNKAAEQIVENFYKNGEFIRIEFEYGSFYVSKSSLVAVAVDEEEYNFLWCESSLNEDDEFSSFSLENYTITNDKSGNIIIKSKN
jgi:hypothetical protein